MHTGHCHCGAVRYEVDAEPKWSALCHCADCRRHAGAPVVGWSAFRGRRPKGLSRVSRRYIAHPSTGAGTSAPTAARASFISTRSTCRASRTYRARRSTIRCSSAADSCRLAERLAWMERAHELPAFRAIRPKDDSNLERVDAERLDELPAVALVHVLGACFELLRLAGLGRTLPAPRHVAAECHDAFEFDDGRFHLVAERMRRYRFLLEARRASPCLRSRDSH